MKFRVSATSHVIFLIWCHSISFALQLIWGNVIFVSVVAVFLLELIVARIAQTKLKTTA